MCSLMPPFPVVSEDQLVLMLKHPESKNEVIPRLSRRLAPERMKGVEQRGTEQTGEKEREREASGEEKGGPGIEALTALTGKMGEWNRKDWGKAWSCKHGELCEGLGQASADPKVAYQISLEKS